MQEGPEVPRKATRSQKGEPALVQKKRQTLRWAWSPSPASSPSAWRSLPPLYSGRLRSSSGRRRRCAEPCRSPREAASPSPRPAPPSTRPSPLSSSPNFESTGKCNNMASADQNVHGQNFISVRCRKLKTVGNTFDKTILCFAFKIVLNFFTNYTRKNLQRFQNPY